MLIKTNLCFSETGDKLKHHLRLILEVFYTAHDDLILVCSNKDRSTYLHKFHILYLLSQYILFTKTTETFIAPIYILCKL